jgi:hypothetical protein
MTLAPNFQSTVVKMGLCSLLLILEPYLSSQEVEGNGNGTGALFSPADYMEISTPLTARVGANVYSFCLGNVQAGIALIEVTTKLSNHLVVTPSYLFIKVPANGLALLTQEPQSVGYREHQFRMSATLSASWHHFNFAERNMYARRFTPTGDVDRYRNKVFVGREISVGTYRCSPFEFDEIYHDVAPVELAPAQLGRSWRGLAGEPLSDVSGVLHPAGRSVLAQRQFSRSRRACSHRQTLWPQMNGASRAPITVNPLLGRNR